jgi:DNA-binding GntR family transcriptional regulator
MQKIESQTLNARAYDMLRAELALGSFEPEQPLVARTLAASLGISATPIREALGRLAAEGIVEVRPNHSIAIPKMTKERYRELVRIRGAVEGLAAEMAAERLTRLHHEHLREVAARAKKATQKNDVRSYIPLTRDFHFAIYNNCGSLELIKLIKDLWLKCAPVLNMLYDSDDFPLAFLDPHDKILAALERRDGVLANEITRQTLSQAADVIVQLIFTDDKER